MSGGTTKRYASRFEEVMCHTTRYAFEGRARLATDCGLSKMSISRLLSGRHNPSYRVVYQVIKALEADLGRHLDAVELISYGDRFERPVCEICGCPGCLPDGALGDGGELTEAYRNVSPGTWMSFPRNQNHEAYRS